MISKGPNLSQAMSKTGIGRSMKPAPAPNFSAMQQALMKKPKKKSAKQFDKLSGQ